MNKHLLALSLVLVLSACGAEEAKKEEPKAAAATVTPAAASTPAAPAAAGKTFANEIDKVSYGIGASIAGGFVASIPRYKELGYEFNEAEILRGVQDTLKKSTVLTEDEIRTSLMEFHQKVSAKQQEHLAKVGDENKTKGAAFLAENAKKDGVKVTASGLQYKVITEGKGKKPKADDKVSVHYKGTLLDGTQFDSSYERGQPAEFPVNGVIQGWVEALQLMTEGSKWQLFIPSELAYGDRGTPNIPPHSVLTFEVELLSILPAEAAKPAAEPAAAPAPAKK